MKGLKRLKTGLGLIAVVVLALSVLLIKAPLYYQVRSYAVMYAFSKYEEKNSLLKKEAVEMKIPGGTITKEKDWYPFVMVFTDDKGFSTYMGRDLALTILYNFGAFRWNQSASDYFLEESPYYNSFYGGYLVKEEGQKKYGFSDSGGLDIKEVFAVPEYDYQYLVMESLGCSSSRLVMDILSYNITEDIAYAGYQGWTQIDASLLVNSPKHKFSGERRAYIQYGNPAQLKEQEDFPLSITNGRIYIRFFENIKSTVFLYILSPNNTTLEECDDKILSKTTIVPKIKA
jgi:hypothetical protein